MWILSFLFFVIRIIGNGGRLEEKIVGANDKVGTQLGSTTVNEKNSLLKSESRIDLFCVNPSKR